MPTAAVKPANPARIFRRVVSILVTSDRRRRDSTAPELLAGVTSSGLRILRHIRVANAASGENSPSCVLSIDVEPTVSEGPVRANAPAGKKLRAGVWMPRPRKPTSPFRYFNSSPEIIRLVVMMYVRFPLSLRNVEDLLAERGIDICHETVRHWWNRFGPLFAADVRRQRLSRMRGFCQWRWHLDEVYVKILEFRWSHAKPCCVECRQDSRHKTATPSKGERIDDLGRVTGRS